MVSDKTGSTITHNDASIDASITEDFPITTKQDAENKIDEESSIAMTAIEGEEKVPTAVEEPYTTFSKARLLQFLFITSLSAMLSPLTGTIYFPSVNQIESVSLFS